MKTSLIATIISAVLLVAAPMEAPMAQAQTPSPSSSILPNGASTLNETYDDWTVICAPGDEGRICVMSQQQRKNDTGQLVLAAEFDNVSDSAIEGKLILPFGLRLADGVVLQVDDKPASDPLPVQTCLPVGCIVPVSFDAETISALRSGTTLKLQTKAYDTGRDVLLAVSLKGFSAAQNRAAGLAQD